MRSFVRFGVAIFICAFGVSACRAPVAKDSGFLSRYDQLKESDTAPFNALWIEPGTDFRSFDSVTVASIDTSHLLALGWWDKTSLAISSKDSTPEKEAAKLATLFRETLIEKLRNAQSAPRYEEKTSGSTLRLELAITEVVPTKVWLNSVAYLLAGAFDHGSTAMEGRIRDLRSGRVLARWKDHQYGQTSLVNVADLTWYSHSRHTVEYWSQLIAELLHSAPGDHLTSRSTVTLKPW